MLILDVARSLNDCWSRTAPFAASSWKCIEKTEAEFGSPKMFAPSEMQMELCFTTKARVRMSRSANAQRKKANCCKQPRWGSVRRRISMRLWESSCVTFARLQVGFSDKHGFPDLMSECWNAARLGRGKARTWKNSKP